MNKITSLEELEVIRSNGLKKYMPDAGRIAVGCGTCGIGNGANDVYSAFEKELKKRRSKVFLTKTGC
ncbi:MAG: (2Fe-2S) ferredoxin domain-containing protein, partial [Candidatus Omnitrophica bacterium]|nr:(2Fe-2S) ferredoxin domain-containing protein [Candidatus Omnitrophota bacterium]